MQSHCYKKIAMSVKSEKDAIFPDATSHFFLHAEFLLCSILHFTLKQFGSLKPNCFTKKSYYIYTGIK